MEMRLTYGMRLQSRSVRVDDEKGKSMKKMIKKGLLLTLGLSFCAGVFGGALPLTVAHAGKSEQKVVTSDMYAEELSNQKWYKTRDISCSDGKIVFAKNRTDESSQIVSVVLANDLRDMDIDTCINGTVTVKVNETLGGEFYIGFGLERPYSEVNTASAICLYNDGDTIGLKVENFVGEDMGTVYTAETTYGYGEEIVINFDVFSVGTMLLKVNGESMMDHDNEKLVCTNGYFGFGQSAGSSVEIYNAEVRAATYDTPTNTNFTETFSDGFNAAILYSEGGSGGYYAPENVVCEDGVLKFNNVTMTGYISTKYEYSNFTMTYDVPHIQREAITDDKGNVITPATNWMGVSIGCSSIKTNSSVAVAQSLFFYMMPTYVSGNAVSFSCVLLNNYSTLKMASVSGDKNFFALENGYDGEGNERTVNLKVQMLDGVLQAFVKYEGEPENRYAKIFEYNLGYTPMGYVQIWGYGDDFSYVQNNIANGRESYCANFWIDNLKIENKDENGVTIDAGYQSSKLPEQSDFVYVDEWDNRAETIFGANPPETSGCGGSLSVGSAMLAFFACGVALIKKGGKEE